MTEKIKDNYDSWAGQYDVNINPTRDLDKIATIKFLSKIYFSNVLELGCGTGKNTEWLITKADSLVGLDFSKNMLDLAMEKVKSNKVTFIKTNLNQEWPVDNNSFDLATINLTLEHIEKLDHIFHSLNKKLSASGKCFVCELHPKKQAVGSMAQYLENGIKKELDTYQHSERDYIKNAEEAGFVLLSKKEWWDNKEDLPRLISFLFEKSK
jgi:ubiquinone/menaquinone biosynthesis C-methylase UbiE